MKWNKMISIYTLCSPGQLIVEAFYSPVKKNGLYTLLLIPKCTLTVSTEIKRVIQRVVPRQS